MDNKLTPKHKNVTPDAAPRQDENARPESFDDDVSDVPILPTGAGAGAAGMTGERVLWEAVDDLLFQDAPPDQRAHLFQTAYDQAQKSLGEVLKERRRKIGFTPTQAGLRTRIPPALWRNWEANVTIPSGDELERAAGLVGGLGQLRVLRRQAPTWHLQRLLRSSSGKAVARTTHPSSEGESLQLALANLDPLVRQALERWAAQRGQSLEASLQALRTADPEEKEALILKIAGLVAWDDDAADEN